MNEINKKRQILLADILELKLPLDDLAQKLNNFEWDSEPLVTLTKANIHFILNRYLSGLISEKTVEDWANLIENRDDIGFENGYEKLILDTIIELANPLLFSPLTPHRAQKLILLLRG